MGLKIAHRTGTSQEFEMLNEPLTGLLLQDPVGQIQQEDMGGTDLAADADGAQNKASFGIPFLIEVTIDTEETGGAATDVLSGLSGAPLDVFPTYDSTATALTTGCPFKMKICDVWCVLLDESAGSVADTIMVQRLDTDGSTQTDITDAMSLNAADDAVVRAATLDQDACVIDVGENIRFDVVLANSANHATCVKVYLLCMRTISDE